MQNILLLFSMIRSYSDGKNETVNCICTMIREFACDLRILSKMRSLVGLSKFSFVYLQFIFDILQWRYPNLLIIFICC